MFNQYVVNQYLFLPLIQSNKSLLLPSGKLSSKILIQSTIHQIAVKNVVIIKNVVVPTNAAIFDPER